MTTDDKKQAHYELVELLNATCEPDQYQVAYDETKKFLLQNPNDANAQYMFGYACYGLSYSKQEALTEAEQSFQKSLELEPDQYDRQMIIYHLGFVYFRQKRYQETLTLLQGRNPNFFNSIDQFWRIPKLDEVELACHYYSNPTKLSLKGAEDLERQYARFVENCEAPLLIEISGCLNQLLSNASEVDSSIDEICTVIVRTIRHLGQSDLFKKREGPFYQLL